MQTGEEGVICDNSVYLLDEKNTIPFDFGFVTEKGEYITRCHAVILGLWSPIMRICCHDKRFNAQASSMKIDLNSLDVSDFVFSKFVRSLYYLPDKDPTKMENYNEESVFDVLRLSILYRVDRLIGYCIRFICSIDVSEMHEMDIATLFDNLCNIVSIEDTIDMASKQMVDVGIVLMRLLGEIMTKTYASYDRENTRCFFDNRDGFVPQICEKEERGIKRKISQEDICPIPDFYLRGLEKKENIQKKTCRRRLFFEVEMIKKKPDRRLDITWYQSDTFQCIADRLSIKSLCWILSLRSREKGTKTWKAIRGKTSLVIMLLVSLLHREAREKEGSLTDENPYSMSHGLKKVVDFVARSCFRLGVNDERSFIIDELDKLRITYPKYHEKNILHLSMLNCIRWSI